jgi:hypothetical protein
VTVSSISKAQARRARLRRFLAGVLRISVLVYLGCLLILYTQQEAMIFPGHSDQGASATPPDGVTQLSWKGAHGDRIVAWWGAALRPDGTPVPSDRPRKTLLYFYGNGTYLTTDGSRIQRFRRLGVDVLMPEFVGYGMSSGQPSEQGCYDTADAAYTYLTDVRKLPASRIISSGASLGGAPAIDLAARHPVGGLATFSTFTGMVEMARRQVPLFPVSLLLRPRFESEEKIRRVACPIFLSHGTVDDLIPFSMRDRLAAAGGGPVTRYTIEGAGHNDFYSIGGEPFMRALQRWIKTLP